MSNHSGTSDNNNDNSDNNDNNDNNDSNNRASIGVWGSSKSAASTPNLTNLSKNSDFFGPYPLQGAVSGMGPTSAKSSSGSGSGSGSGAKSSSSGHSAASSESSFQQRRKRSESIGGLKTFEDKDAPPTPVMHNHSNHSTASHQSASSASIGNSYVSYISNTDVPVPDIPALPSNHFTGLGPLDNLTSIATITPTSTPPIPTSLDKSTTDSQSECSQGVTNPVESWLRRSQTDLSDATPAEETDVVFTTTASAAAASSSSLAHNISNATMAGATTAKMQGRRPSQGFRRPSHTSTASTMDDDDSEIEDIAVPISVLTLNSNRLSRIHETGSTHMNESQTSLFCSTKSAHSEEADEQGNGGNDTITPSKRLTANITRSSILFSEFGLSVSNKELPSTPDLDPFSSVVESGDKPLPRRPVSMFSPTTSPTSLFEFHDDSRATDIVAEEAIRLESDTTGFLSPMTPNTSNANEVESHLEQQPKVFNSSLGVPGSGPMGARPATICVSADDANKIAPVTVTFIPLATQELPVEEEGMEALALRTSIRCFQEDTSFLPRDEISIYLGQAKPFNHRVLNLYMGNFNFSRKRLDMAFRQLCQKLILKGETQEVDRILEAFALRYVDCNPQSIFGNKDVVHAITYSILLLNTDLHVVQQSSLSKMSRSAFVKNTLQVVKAQTSQIMDERASEDLSAHGISFTKSTTDEVSINGKKRTPSIKSWKSGTSHQSKNSKMGPDPKANGGHGNGKWWMSELESLLKEIYSSVKHNQILLPTSMSKSAPTTQTFPGTPHSNVGLSLGSHKANSAGNSFLPRMSKQIQPSSFAEAGYNISGASNGATGNAGTGPMFAVMGRRNSLGGRTKQLRQDALQRLNAQALEEKALAPSVPVPETEHKEARPGNSGRRRASTLTPPSISSSLNPHQTNSALPSPVSSVFSNHETQLHSPAPSGKVPQPGHPTRFRMEGILHRKHLLERADKKASNRSWRQLLVVVDQGGLSLFRADGQLGQAFEEQGILFDEIRLQHTITNILPPPGYSSSRKHVFAVQLYTGAVYLFQTANARECEEWARTCNYWAARTSKEPLVGGVVNMDYGWGRSLDLLANGSTSYSMSSISSPTTAAINTMTTTSCDSDSAVGSVTEISELAVSSLPTNSEDEDARSTNNSISAGASFLQHPPPPTSPSLSATSNSAGTGPAGASSYYGFGNSGGGSGRSASIKSASSKYGGSNGANVPLGDRVMLFEWAPPLPTMSMTTLSEEEQCEGLKRYVVGLEAEMEAHQEHRGPMMQLFLPKSHNYSKAFNNWERRSRYLLKEMVKYQIYVECLEQSLQAQKEEQRLAEEAASEDTAKLEAELQHLDVDDEDNDQVVGITINGDSVPSTP
ncbi:hypothetical protein BGZ79_001345 [Entomortierella chlamydospora]|nr:hypothetical protein BGZ79_001345 [Entomortierella chlamydospora]